MQNASIREYAKATFKMLVKLIQEILILLAFFASHLLTPQLSFWITAAP